MADNNTLKPPEKKIKTATPISKSCTMRIMDQDTYELKDVTEASELTGYLSALGRNIIKKSLQREEPLDLKAINQTVMEKEVRGYHHCKVQPKKGDKEDDENGAEEIGNEEAIPNDFATEENIAEAKIDKSDTIKINNSKEYPVKVPFIKSNSTKAKNICLFCGIIPCKTKVYGDLLKKLAKDVAEKKANNNRAICQSTNFYYFKVWQSG